ncbi:MAG TPA: hypothetical protein VFU31_17560 [Candidatus Binatia bacterium]|nr:hypothetical protein [Candidatus Binatia bacterium]
MKQTFQDQMSIALERIYSKNKAEHDEGIRLLRKLRRRAQDGSAPSGKMYHWLNEPHVIDYILQQQTWEKQRKNEL